jgi:hypothetical protein
VDKLRVDRSDPRFSASNTSISDVFIRDPDVLCVKGICIGTITRVGMLMPNFDGEDFTFAPVFDVLYDWLLIFLSMRKKNFLGEQRFLDFRLFELSYHSVSLTHKEV